MIALVLPKRNRFWRRGCESVDRWVYGKLAYIAGRILEAERAAVALMS